VTLSDPRDAEVLSEFLTFIRAECLEIFDSNSNSKSNSNSTGEVAAAGMIKSAPAEETATASTSTLTAPAPAPAPMTFQSWSQVGVRCRFCAHIHRRHRAARSQSFPSTISRIYQSLTMMIRDHFPKCAEMPEDVQAKFHNLKRKPKNVGHCVVTPSGSGGDGGDKNKNQSRLAGAGSGLGNAARYTKNYWTESALRCGLYDSPDGDGIRYHSLGGAKAATLAATPAAASAAATDGVPPVKATEDGAEDATDNATDVTQTEKGEVVPKEGASSPKKRRKVDEVAEALDESIQSEAL